MNREETSWVIGELKRQGKVQEGMRDDISILKTDIAVEKSKLKWIAGGISGLVSSITAGAVVIGKHVLGGQ